SDRDDLIYQHLPPGTYVLKVHHTGGVGDYSMTATLTPAVAPFRPLDAQPVAGFKAYTYDPLTTGDFNADGIPDLVGPDGVRLGVGDGTFQNPRFGLGLPTTPARPNWLTVMASGEFNGDGRLDLAIAYTNPGGLYVLRGNGDGSFQPPARYETGTFVL